MKKFRFKSTPVDKVLDPLHKRDESARVFVRACGQSASRSQVDTSGGDQYTP